MDALLAAGFALLALLGCVQALNWAGRGATSGRPFTCAARALAWTGYALVTGMFFWRCVERAGWLA